MGVVDEALTRALAGRVPSDVRGAAASVGGRSPNAQLARAMEGIGAGRLPREGSAERRRYEATLRQLQRYQAPAGRQARGQKRPSRTFVGRAVAAARAIVSAARVARARRRGLLMRIRMAIRVSRAFRVHTMPADVGGRPRFQLVNGQLAGPALDEWVAGRLADAGEQLLAGFFTAYWGEASPGEFGDIEFCQVRIP